MILAQFNAGRALLADQYGIHCRFAIRLLHEINKYRRVDETSGFFGFMSNLAEKFDCHVRTVFNALIDLKNAGLVESTGWISGPLPPNYDWKRLENGFAYRWSTETGRRCCDLDEHAQEARNAKAAKIAAEKRMRHMRKPGKPSPVASAPRPVASSVAIVVSTTERKAASQEVEIERRAIERKFPYIPRKSYDQAEAEDDASYGIQFDNQTPK